MDIQTCVQCGTSAYPNDRFCGNCGTKLRVAGLQIWSNDYTPLPPQKKARRQHGRRNKRGRKSLIQRLGLIKMLLITTAVMFGGLHVPNTSAHLQTGDHDGLTILLMGVDAHDDEEIDIGVRPDSLSVLHLNPKSGTCRILGVPRDSRVDVPGVGLTKINHALANGGIPLQQRTVENYLGISIDHYGLVDFEGMASMVDAVGSITVTNPYGFGEGNDYLTDGEIVPDGRQALRNS